MELRPSPEELVGLLLDEELVALDLLLEKLPNNDQDRRAIGDPAVADLGPDDQVTLCRILPDPIRRGVVVTVGRQLKRLGVSIRPRKTTAP